ncbi:bifunctional enoyl-CoA hydratase/phosphate acetyltransferase [bacterium]|nr:bifunctional enoyl-CoA hydratase/phosphate acetyltransferase [bacterium]
MNTFKEVCDATKDYPVKVLAVVEAADVTVLSALKMSHDANLAKAILFGRKSEIEKVAEQCSFSLGGVSIRETRDEIDSAREAALCVREGKADILMKGHIHTDDFLRGVLDREAGLRSGQFMSHVFILQREGKLLLVSDGAMNIAPIFEDKAKIILNALHLAEILKIEQPRVAVLAAVELVNPRMPATLDAACLHKMNDRKQFSPDCFLEGPFALDNAVDEKAARHKGITGNVPGKADILIVPNIESGNMLVKSFVYFAGGKVAGVLVGASVPVVLTSRADSDESKFNSIAVAVLMSGVQRHLKLKVGRVNY